MSAEDARVGRFELVFHAGDYFRRQGRKLADPPFLDVVPIRFAVADPGRALSRAPARLAVELFHLSWKLKDATISKLPATIPKPAAINSKPERNNFQVQTQQNQNVISQ